MNVQNMTQETALVTEVEIDEQEYRIINWPDGTFEVAEALCRFEETRDPENPEDTPRISCCVDKWDVMVTGVGYFGLPELKQMLAEAEHEVQEQDFCLRA